MQKSAYGGPKGSTEKPSSRDRRKLSVKKSFFFFHWFVVALPIDFVIFLIKLSCRTPMKMRVFKLKISEIKIVSFQLFYLISLETPFGDDWINCNKDQVNRISEPDLLSKRELDDVKEARTLWPKCTKNWLKWIPGACGITFL